MSEVARLMRIVHLGKGVAGIRNGQAFQLAESEQSDARFSTCKTSRLPWSFVLVQPSRRCLYIPFKSKGSVGLFHYASRVDSKSTHSCWQ